MKQPLELSTRAQMACDLQNHFYTDLSGNYMSLIAQYCCTGIARTAQAQIRKRQNSGNPTLSYARLEWIGRNPPKWVYRFLLYPLFRGAPVRVVSDRCAPLPDGLDIYVRQCVVKISSLQSLKVGNKETVMKPVTEYVVMQKMIKGFQAGPWMLWGTIKASTLEEIGQMMVTVKKYKGERPSLRTRISMLYDRSKNMLTPAKSTV